MSSRMVSGARKAENLATTTWRSSLWHAQRFLWQSVFLAVGRRCAQMTLASMTWLTLMGARQHYLALLATWGVMMCFPLLQVCPVVFSQVMRFGTKLSSMLPAPWLYNAFPTQWPRCAFQNAGGGVPKSSSNMHGDLQDKGGTVALNVSISLCTLWNVFCPS